MTPAAPEFSGAVLAGGRSTRMGRDKAFVPVGGRPMAARVLDALRASGAVEVLAVGGDGAGLLALGFDRFVADERPGEGPLGGLVTALRAATVDVVVVLACDLPAADPGAVTAVVGALAGHDVAIAVTDRLEPLHAAWRRRPSLAALEAAFTAGERAVHRALAGLDVVQVPVAAEAVRNVNRPADLPG